MSDIVQILQKIPRLVVVFIILSLPLVHGHAGVSEFPSQPSQSSLPGPVALVRLDPQVRQPGYSHDRGPNYASHGPGFSTAGGKKISGNLVALD